MFFHLNTKEEHTAAVQLQDGLAEGPGVQPKQGGINSSLENGGFAVVVVLVIYHH